MRYLKMISILSILFIMMGSGEKEVKLTEGIKPGNLAPVSNLQGIEIEENNYVLVQFWAATDPQSRLENTRMHNVITGSGDGAVKLFSICLDENEAVYKGVVKTDDLDELTQKFLPKEKQSTLFKKHKLNAKSENWLIDPNGVIVATHLSPQEVLDIVK